MPLRRDVPFHTAHVTDNRGAEFAEHVMWDGASWFHVTRRGKQWLLHGSVASSGSALYVFMEHPEARHPELEAALSRDAHAAEVYADWLAEQGDPFGGALIPALAKERGPAGLWWMEGFERSGALTVTQRDGFVREAVLGAIPPDELLSTVHRLCHVRAFVALERLRIDPASFRERAWSSIFNWSMWTDCQWPRSLKRLAFGGRQGLTRPKQDELKAFQTKVSRKHPSIVIEA
jgi:hypothetical protein